MLQDHPTLPVLCTADQLAPPSDDLSLARLFEAGRQGGYRHSPPAARRQLSEYP